MRWSDYACRAVLLAATATPAWALPQVPGPIEIGPSWGRTDSNGGASLYTTITNRGVLADRLTGGSCAGFRDVSLAGLAGPSASSGQPDSRGVLIEPGATATLQPDAPHLAIADTGRATAPGALISCTLSFVHSGQRLVVFRIGNPEPAVREP